MKQLSLFIELEEQRWFILRETQCPTILWEPVNILLCLLNCDSLVWNSDPLFDYWFDLFHSCLQILNTKV